MEIKTTRTILETEEPNTTQWVKVEDVERTFNWMWKAYLKKEYTQQQFSRMFRKELKGEKW